jgi:SAM-dependent methyltransferase
MSNSAKIKIPADVLAILARATITGNVLVLPEQLDRETYLRVAKALTAARGKWDRKVKGHVFPFDPRELMADVVDTATLVDAKKTLQFFETPAALARRMVDLAQLAPGNSALEPSAGLGRIVREMLVTGAKVCAIEIDPINIITLRDIVSGISPNGEGDLQVYQIAFEEWHTDCLPVDVLYDAVVMNPPFANNLDMKHIRLAWDMLVPGGRLVAICSEGPFFRQDRAAVAFREWLDGIDSSVEKLPPGTFRESGTDVATRLIVAIR